MPQDCSSCTFQAKSAESETPIMVCHSASTLYLQIPKPLLRPAAGGEGCNSRRCWTCPCLSFFSIRLCSASGRWHLGRLNSPEHAERVSSCSPPTGQLFPGLRALGPGLKSLLVSCKQRSRGLKVPWPSIFFMLLERGLDWSSALYYPSSSPFFLPPCYMSWILSKRRRRGLSVCRRIEQD